MFSEQLSLIIIPSVTMASYYRSAAIESLTLLLVNQHANVVFERRGLGTVSCLTEMSSVIE